MKIETWFRSALWSNGGSEHDMWHQRGTPLGNLDLFKRAATLEDFSQALQEISGFHTLVKRNATEIFAGVDHIRSLPLFYGESSEGFFLSDDAEWVRQKVGDEYMEPLAKEEFQLAGYVTGSDTLFPHVKQLQAGECLRASVGGHRIQIDRSRYYRFLHTSSSSLNCGQLFNSFDKVVKESIKRLIEYANGRQIVIPLSGGYDSRLIASLLKESNYQNIITFSYGVKGNEEAARSEEVANTLGLRWVLVEYTNELWREAWQTKQREHYQKWASGWSSIAHLQDWLAVKILKERSIVDGNCVFVPGHCCVTGLMPESVFKAQKTASLMKASALAEALRHTHFSLVRSKAAKKLFHNKLKPQLALTYPLAGTDSLTPEEFAREFMIYGWQERQAKYICNSVRVYEAFGFNWWLPLWDKEVATFWQDMPLELIENRAWYKKYVNKKFYNNSGAGELKAPNMSRKESKVKSLVRKVVFSHAGLKSLFLVIHNKTFQSSDAMARSGRFDKKLFDELLNKGFSYLGITVYVFMQDFGGKSRLD